MRKNILLAAVAATFVAAGPAVAAPASDTTSAAARGVVLQAHSLTRDTDLDFGVVTVDASGGTVSISADALGNRTTTSGVTAFTSTHQAAKFTGAAAPLETVQLTLTPPTGGVIHNTSDNTKTIAVALGTDAPGNTLTTDSAGAFTVYVGGTFTLGSNQAAGVYTDNFDLNAEYQ